MLLLTDFSDTPVLSLQSGTREYGSWDARRSFSGAPKELVRAAGSSRDNVCFGGPDWHEPGLKLEHQR
ncbi:hypothetical protein [Bradyrhizobium sp. Leo121]|uniref:hypothetical protein n=1 Tax=Bradyrhizobium sp. Leo121 TaxID=1571195 RepID=UPI001028A1BB|nr:hypothetical protein [Bradyrhizobium sp. Leo121]RZN13759.1 hypothetical protein CWO90_44235 [Bradyrhizobium sp. Leo121]